jgi:hypothetical protein
MSARGLRARARCLARAGHTCVHSINTDRVGRVGGGDEGLLQIVAIFASEAEASAAVVAHGCAAARVRRDRPGKLAQVPCSWLAWPPVLVRLGCRRRDVCHGLLRRCLAARGQTRQRLKPGAGSRSAWSKSLGSCSPACSPAHEQRGADGRSSLLVPADRVRNERASRPARGPAGRRLCVHPARRRRVLRRCVRDGLVERPGLHR